MNNFPLKLLMLVCFVVLASCTSEEIIVEETIEEVITTPPVSEKPIEVQILELLNAHRASIGLNTLNELNIIKTQTSNHTDYMIDNNAISHDYFYQRKEYLVDNANAVLVGENVAVGYSSAESVVRAWLNSQGHKENIEGNFTHFNITAKQDTNGRWYYTNIFIKQ